MHRFASIRRTTAFVLLVATTLTACTSWQVQTVAPEQVVTTQSPSAVRVQRLDGTRVVVDGPRISDDSLRGATVGKPISVPLADIYQVAVKRGSPGKSIGLALGIVAGVIVIGYIALASSCNGTYNCGF